MQTHLKLLGVLNVVAGVLTLLGAAAGGVGVAVLSFQRAALARSTPEGRLPPMEHEWVLDVALWVFVVLLLVVAAVALLGLVGGVGLLKGRTWARRPVLVASVLQLLHVPLGTVLGVYGLWVLLSEEGRRALGRPAEG